MFKIALLLSVPALAQAGGLFPAQPAPMSQGYGVSGQGVHSAVPMGVPSEACVINPVSMTTTTRDTIVTRLVPMDKFSIPSKVLFDFDRDEVRPEGREELAKVYDALVEGGVISISVTGHTDSKGTDEYNIDLGQRRADAVASVLVGMGMELVDTLSAGESEPVAPNDIDGVDNPDGRQENRRVVIEVLEVAPRYEHETIEEVVPRNPQIFHVMSSGNNVICASALPPAAGAMGGFIFNGYYPSNRIYGNGTIFQR